MKLLKIPGKKKGSSSIMVILIMVTLVVFGVLAMMSSYSDIKLANKNSNMLVNYYRLDAKGQELLEGIDSALVSTAREMGNRVDKEAYFNKVTGKIKAIRPMGDILIQKDKGALVISGTVSDEDKNKLAISLRINKPAAAPGQYQIIAWKQLPKEFKYDEGIQLWDGGEN